MPREGGLGKGLSSLIPQKNSSTNSQQNSNSNQKIQKDFVSNDFDSEIAPKDFKTKDLEPKNSVLEVDIEDIKANPFQPRQYFDENKLNELAVSIKKHGIIQPLVVTESPEGGYELIAGERRFKASKKSGLTKVPVIVKRISDKEKLEWALIENIHRHDLNSIEEAEAYQNLVKNFNYTQEEVANQVGKSRSTVANTLRLLDLSELIKKKIRSGKISEGHARVLLSLENEQNREELAEEIINSGMSVREAERKAKTINNHGKDKINGNKSGLEVAEFENKISQALGTKVVIRKGARGGKFILNFYSEEEFGSLFNKLIS